MFLKLFFIYQIRKMSVVSSASQSLKYKPTLAPLAIEEISELFEDGPSPGHNETAPPGKGDHPGQSPYAHYENETKHVVVYSAEMVEAVATAHGSDDPHSNGSLNNCPSGTRTRYDSNNCSQGTRRSSGNSQVSYVTLLTRFGGILLDIWNLSCKTSQEILLRDFETI